MKTDKRKYGGGVEKKKKMRTKNKKEKELEKEKKNQKVQSTEHVPFLCVDYFRWYNNRTGVANAVRDAGMG